MNEEQKNKVLQYSEEIICEGLGHDGKRKIDAIVNGGGKEELLCYLSDLLDDKMCDLDVTISDLRTEKRKVDAANQYIIEAITESVESGVYGEFEVKRRKSPGKVVESADRDDDYVVPSQYTKLTRSTDTAKISRDIKRGIRVDGFEMEYKDFAKIYPRLGYQGEE